MPSKLCLQMMHVALCQQLQQNSLVSPVLLSPMRAPVKDVDFNIFHKLGNLVSQLGTQSSVIPSPDQQCGDFLLFWVLHHSTQGPHLRSFYLACEHNEKGAGEGVMAHALSICFTIPANIAMGEHGYVSHALC